MHSPLLGNKIYTNCPLRQYVSTYIIILCSQFQELYVSCCWMQTMQQEKNGMCLILGGHLIHMLLFSFTLYMYKVLLLTKHSTCTLLHASSVSQQATATCTDHGTPFAHVCSGYVLPPLVHEFTLHQLPKENATSAQVAASDTTTSACVCISAYVCVHI